MKELDFEPTSQELFSAMGAFVMALSVSMPKELADRIAKNLSGLAQQIAEHGDTRTGTLATELADAIRMVHPPAKH